MATMLTGSSRTMLFSLGIAEHDVVERVYRGLTGEDAVFTPQEAVWVVHRMAELLGWDMSMRAVSAKS